MAEGLRCVPVCECDFPISEVKVSQRRVDLLLAGDFPAFREGAFFAVALRAGVFFAEAFFLAALRVGDFLAAALLGEALLVTFFLVRTFFLAALRAGDFLGEVFLVAFFLGIFLLAALAKAFFLPWMGKFSESLSQVPFP